MSQSRVKQALVKQPLDIFIFPEHFYKVSQSRVKQALVKQEKNSNALGIT
jgi:hypothetical protein